MARGRGYVTNARQRVAAAEARQRRGRADGRRGGGGGRGRTGLGPPAPMPWDSTAQRESGELGNEAADTRASLAAKFAAAQNALGFGSGVGNPYSQSVENKTALQNNRRGITNTAGNQLYAGSTANKLSAARSEYDKTQKSLEDSYSEAQNAYTRGAAQTGRDEALGQQAIREGAISRAAASEPEPLGVGGGRRAGPARRRRGRGRVSGPGADGRNVRRPARARALNARARQIRAGRGRV